MNTFLLILNFNDTVKTHAAVYSLLPESIRKNNFLVVVDFKWES